MANSSHPSTLSHVLETILYTKDLPKARNFYTNTLHLKPNPTIDSPRAQGYQLGQTLLLIFALGETNDDIIDPSNPELKIPCHGPSEDLVKTLLDESWKAQTGVAERKLRQHYCLATEAVEDVRRWQRYLAENGVPILGRMEWPPGGESVYFEDPDGHVGEIASRRIWSNY